MRRLGLVNVNTYPRNMARVKRLDISNRSDWIVVRNLVLKVVHRTVDADDDGCCCCSCCWEDMIDGGNN